MHFHTLVAYLTILVLATSPLAQGQERTSTTASSAPQVFNDSVSFSPSPLQKITTSMPNHGFFFQGGLGQGFRSTFSSGLGVRLGLAIESGLYFGAQYTRHFGTTAELSQIKIDQNSWYSTLELGYSNLDIGTANVRPYLGLGVQNFFGKARNGDSVLLDRDANKFVMVPGVLVQFPLQPRYWVGADLRYVFSTGDFATEASAVGLFLLASIRL